MDESRRSEMDFVLGIASCPGCKGLWRLHLEAWGEPLPYVFLGELLESLKDPGFWTHEAIKCILDAIELGLITGDEPLLDLLVVGFIDDIVSTELAAALRVYMGPRTRKWIKWRSAIR